MTKQKSDTFFVGDRVVCRDDSDGANFLAVGRTYVVGHIQTDDQGEQRVCLVGMARAWETARFYLAGHVS